LYVASPAPWAKLTALAIENTSANTTWDRIVFVIVETPSLIARKSEMRRRARHLSVASGPAAAGAKTWLSRS
jgi:hypothetical protein